MKTLNSRISILLILVTLVAINSFGQTWCLSMDEVSNDGSTYVISIRLQGSEAFELGSANIQFSTPIDAVIQEEASVVAEPWSAQNYLPATITVPYPEQGICSYNIELFIPDTGYEIAAFPIWTEIGQISFPISDIDEFTDFSWIYDGGTTGTVLFDDDEATQLFATDTDCLIDFEVVGVSELEESQDGINLFPNPTSDIINIDLNDALGEEYTVSIVNVTGQVVLSEQKINKQDQAVKQLDVSTLSEGIYVVHFQRESKTYSKQISILK